MMIHVYKEKHREKEGRARECEGRERVDEIGKKREREEDIDRKGDNQGV